MKFMFTNLLVFLTLIIPGKIWAGSCCGGGGANAKIMTGQTKAVFRSFYQNQSILADSRETSAFQARQTDEVESVETTTFSGSYRISELWQVGAALPIVKKTRSLNDEWTSAEGLGDAQLNLAYEFHPEYSRNQAITQAYVFFQTTLPTAPSLFDQSDKNTLYARGQGHYLYTSGLLALKRGGPHTFTAQGAITYRQPRKFKGSVFGDQEVETAQSWNHNLSLTYAYDVNSTFSLYTSASRDFIENKATSVFIGKSQSSLVYQASIGMVASLDVWDINLSYQDDLLLGNSRNHTLGRALALGLVRRIGL